MGRDTVSVVSNGDPSASTYATPEDAPPTYELATSDRNTIYTPPASEASYSTRASIPLGAESQSLGNDRHVSLSGRQELVPAGSSEASIMSVTRPVNPSMEHSPYTIAWISAQPVEALASVSITTLHNLVGDLGKIPVVVLEVLDH
ncbi:hypothetical protein LTS08_000682 [Lithohypha guttulata]|nr:hypothetical protein LTS08_000682 [Lithohypha guttulata]